jgi:hypothetical protein
VQEPLLVRTSVPSTSAVTIAKPHRRCRRGIPTGRAILTSALSTG